MPRLRNPTARPQDLLARELLDFYDEFAALNCRIVFTLRALASALASEDGIDERSAAGAMFCVQWVNDRTEELELRLKEIRRRCYETPRSRKQNMEIPTKLPE